MTDRSILALSFLIMALCYAVAASAIVAVNLERRECERLNGGPVETRWTLARGCVAKMYPGIVAPVGKRPDWLRLP